ncbi:hypothetical protein FHR99_002499 [Litorivivens lipolytica]|uniref:Winged helix-turn-helix domain-containing protein n=1 Tax=Litorivivens lipolytica TaxID=1524264 RepID=A0A7W4W6H3_9GAMM|nr:crosslink repair DNA glycosylase YcaQ family protein [Litorivivens lipolytica]MBB3048225.1 hypothetical protein [Litorivivens lipolytica]
MIDIKSKTDLQRLQRLALNRQGLTQSQPFGRGLQGARKAVEHLGYIQIDTISVVERAHHHVLYSRVPGYQPEMLNKLLREQHIFEYWSHAAAFLPIRDFRFSLPYKHAIKSGQVHWFKTPDKKLMREVLARIRSDGPLRSRDLEQASGKRAGWWDWKPAKKALEQLYMQGDLMVASREGFEKVYDLSERVLPEGIDTRNPTPEAFAEHLLNQQLACHGLVTLKGLTYLRRDTALRTAMKSLVAARLTEGSLDELRPPSGEIFFAAHDALDHKSARTRSELQILSPFDNAVIQRDRLKALFDFDYQIECYVPEAKRQYGYFCLPLLYRNTFVGRMDCKAHRKSRTLEIKALHFEQNTDDALLDALAATLKRFSGFQQCDVIELTARSAVTQPLRAALQALDH